MNITAQPVVLTAQDLISSWKEGDLHSKFDHYLNGRIRVNRPEGQLAMVCIGAMKHNITDDTHHQFVGRNGRQLLFFCIAERDHPVHYGRQMYIRRGVYSGKARPILTQMRIADHLIDCDLPWMMKGFYKTEATRAILGWDLVQRALVEVADAFYEAVVRDHFNRHWRPVPDGALRVPKRKAPDDGDSEPSKRARCTENSDSSDECDDEEESSDDSDQNDDTEEPGSSKAGDDPVDSECTATDATTTSNRSRSRGVENAGFRPFNPFAGMRNRSRLQRQRQRLRKESPAQRVWSDFIYGYIRKPGPDRLKEVAEAYKAIFKKEVPIATLKQGHEEFFQPANRGLESIRTRVPTIESMSAEQAKWDVAQAQKDAKLREIEKYQKALELVSFSTTGGYRDRTPPDCRCGPHRDHLCPQ
ncbi:hypothetical protein Slin15195_G067220 [Septoria linicola]|uniref:Uncharacterized protein n=1 Tax=Septoria linicola TaxID=215465 RepID=A0A9Q9ELF7_9PEZI|nr:hypothetical protein Slin15195_G067220 [Septoria linicola]